MMMLLSCNSRLLDQLMNIPLFILDDFGLHPIDEQSKLILLELLEDRYGDKSILITHNCR